MTRSAPTLPPAERAAGQAEACPIEMQSVPLGPAPGAAARIGLIALASGLTGEEEMHRVLPAGETLLLTTRVRDSDAVALDNFAPFEAELAHAAATLLPRGHLDVVAYCCAAGAIALGDDVVAARIRAVHPGAAVTTLYAAALAALRALGLRSVALLTPYTEAVSREMVAQLQRDGIRVVRCRAFGIELTNEICHVAPETTAAAARAVDCAAAEAVFICCGGLRVVDRIDAIEAALGKPVIASNQALAWHALRLAGYDKVVPGFGRLLRIGLDRTVAAPTQSIVEPDPARG